MSNVSPALLDAVCRTDLHAFTQKCFAILNPGTFWHSNWHQEAISYQLEKVRRGLCRRLIITLPPRSLKSHFGSVALPAYVLGHDPSKKIICVSYSQDLAGKHASDFRRLMESDWYRLIFPGVRLTKNTAGEIETDRGGFRLTTSVDGTLTGRGADLIILDDPMNANDGYSKAAREATNRWYSRTLITRLDDPSRGAIILIMQRLHEDDLVGYLRRTDGWDILNLPAIAQEDIDVLLSDTKALHWKKGELLHPSRLPTAELDSFKQNMGTDNFNAQFLQAPIPDTGNFLKRDWIKFYDIPPVAQSGDQVVQSWDTAMKAGVNNDYSVCLTFRIRNRNEYYLTDVLRKRLEFPDLLKVVLPHSQKFRADVVLIEEQASGISFVQMAKQAGVQGVLGLKPRGDKETRMRNASPKIEGGSLILPRTAPWLDDFLLEFLAFPRGRHDDQMDALAQLLNWRINQEGSEFEWDFGGNEDESAPTPEEIMFGLVRGY